MDTSRIRLGGWPIALIAAALYTGGMGLVWQFADHEYADTALLVKDVIFALGVLVLIVLALTWWTRIPVHRSGRIGLFGWLAIVPVALSPIGFVLATAGGINNWGLVLTILIGTLLVGIGEETAFRGLALNGLAMKMSLPWAVIVSSILFGLMHSVNILLQSSQATIQQVIMTAIVGVFLGWTYVLTGGNLVLVVILHWLWDFGLIATNAEGLVVGPLAGIGSLLQMVLAVAFTIYGFIKLRGMNWEQWDAKRLGLASGAPEESAALDG